MTPSHRIVLCPACNAKLRVRMADREIALRCPNCSERVDVMPADGIDEATGVPITAARRQQQPQQQPPTQSRPQSRPQPQPQSRPRPQQPQPQEPFSESWSEPAAPKPASRTARMNRLRTLDHRNSESSSTTR
ncbi:MAG: hypothetical protein ACKOEO_07765, partial [Planctomycetaceae bacterium]